MITDQNGPNKRNAYAHTTPSLQKRYGDVQHFFSKIKRVRFEELEKIKRNTAAQLQTVPKAAFKMHFDQSG